MTLREMQKRREAIFATEIDAAETDAELDALDTEVRKLDMMIANEQRKSEPDPVGRTAAVNGEIPGMVVAASTPAQTRTADSDELEYRSAFKDLVLHNKPIPAEVRADANTLTSDVGTAIPTVVVNRIIEKMESTGMIMSRVTRTSYAPGMNVPTSSVKPSAVWVAEGAGSDRQKKSTGSIQFGHNKLRCEISMSMEVGTMAISAFEDTFVRNVSEAMVKAIEQSILLGTGTGQPTGILTATPPTGQALTATAIDYDLLIGAEAALPQAYEAGAVWLMSKKTFMSFIGMVDTAGQPIARVNYGINGAPDRSLLGREVILTGDYLPSFDGASAGTEFALLYRLSDYILNTVYDMGIQRKQDWDTEDLLTKAVMALDGKPVDVNSLVTIAVGTP